MNTASNSNPSRTSHLARTWEEQSAQVSLSYTAAISMQQFKAESQRRWAAARITKDWPGRDRYASQYGTKLASFIDRIRQALADGNERLAICFMNDMSAWMRFNKPGLFFSADSGYRSPKRE